MTSSVPKQKKAYPSNAQKARLIALLEADEQLRAGKFSSTFTKKGAEERWKLIQEELNAIPGAKKQWTEWRKCWQDMRSKCKKKNSIIKKTKTGGGPPVPALTEEEEAVLSIINPVSLVGHADSRESIVIFEGILSDEPALQASSSQKLYNPPPTETPPQNKGILSDEPAVLANSLQEQDNSPTTETPQNKENSGVSRKKLLKKKKNLQDNHILATAYKEALIEKNRLLAEKNELQRIFFREITLQMQQQTNILARIAKK